MKRNQAQQHLRISGQGQNPPANNETLRRAGTSTIVTSLILDGNGRTIQLIDEDLSKLGYTASGLKYDIYVRGGFL